MRRILVVGVSTAAAAALLVWGGVVFGASSAVFAFLVVWVPMTWLGTISRVVQPRLPESYHRLRDVERDGRIYERLGVRVVKRLLRRGPIAVFNPGLHLPSEPSAERIAHLDQRMRDAEAAHFILLVVTCGITLHAAMRGWWTAVLLTLLFNLMMNGYPVMLQRYNRVLLRRRFGALLGEGDARTTA